jgi:hypothetical protein
MGAAIRELTSPFRAYAMPFSPRSCITSQLRTIT